MKFEIEDGKLKKYHGVLGVTDVVIPDGVTSIGQDAFRDCSSLTSVVIPESVTSIGDDAFYGCSRLTNVIIPKSVKDIGRSAFWNCSGLTSVVIPESVTSIGGSAFRGCSSLTSVVIPEGVTSIGDWAFEDCSGLTIVVIPEGVTSIGHEAFSGCADLVSIAIPESVTYIGESAFSKTPWLESKRKESPYVIVNGILIDGSICTGDAVIPEGVSSIGRAAFEECKSLTSVVIPEGVTSIGKQAFNGCRKLTSVIIPDGVTGIGQEAFSGCADLVSIAIPESVTYIGGSAFSKTPWLESKRKQSTCVIINGILIDGSVCTGDVVIPEGVTSIGEQAFKGRNKLTSVTIPEGVTSIGQEAFRDCSRLTSVLIPKSVKDIGYGAFYHCSGLTSVVIPEGVTSIGNFAFSDCSSLTNVVIPEGVTSIGNFAFSDCSSLTNVVIPEGVTSIGKQAFIGCRKLTSRVIPDSSNRGCLTSVVIPDGVTSIGNFAFSDCSSLTSVVIPNSVTSIGGGAFWCCSGLTSVVIPEGVTSIGASAFRGCRGLTEVVIPESVTSIGGMPFSGTPWLELERKKSPFVIVNGILIDGSACTGKVVIPDSVTSIGACAFSNNENITGVIIPECVTSIGDSAFSDCSKLKTAVIPDGVTSIGTGAFSDCSSLTEIVFNSTAAEIASDALSGCNHLRSVIMPAGVRVVVYLEGHWTVSTVLRDMFPETLYELTTEIKLADFPPSHKPIAVRGFCRSYIEGRIFPTEQKKEYDAYIKRIRNKLIQEPIHSFTILYLLREKMIKEDDIDALIENLSRHGDAELSAAAIEYKRTNFKTGFEAEMKRVEKSIDKAQKKLEKKLELERLEQAPVSEKIAAKRRLSEREKVELLEEAVLGGTVEDVRAFFAKFGSVEFSARALGYAARYGGREKVRVLLENGANFSFKTCDSATQRKYNVGIAITNRYTAYKNYSLMLIPGYKSVGWGNQIDEFKEAAKKYGLTSLPEDERVEIAKMLFPYSEKASMSDTDMLVSEAIKQGELSFARKLLSIGYRCGDVNYIYLYEMRRAVAVDALSIVAEHGRLVIDQFWLDDEGYLHALKCAENSLRPEVYKLLLEHVEMTNAGTNRFAEALAKMRMKESLLLVIGTGKIKPGKAEKLLKQASGEE